MTFTAQNYQDQVGPPVSAAWLNGVDVICYSIMQGAQTLAQAQAALGIPTFATPLGVNQGGTGAADGPHAMANLGGVAIADLPADVAGIVTRSYIGNLEYPQTTVESSHSIVPTDTTFVPGNILRYGADPTGVLDSSNAIAAALLCNSRVYAPSGLYKCSQQFNVGTNQTVMGDGASTIFQYATGLLNNFQCSGINGAIFRDFTIQILSTTGIATTYGAIYLLNSSYSTVERVTVTGYGWSGVWLDGGSNYNTVQNCTFTNAQEQILNGIPAGTGADVSIYSSHGGGIAAPSYNKILNNNLLGGGGYGVQILDEFATTGAGLPFRNLVSGNRVTQHRAYGLLLYLPGSGSGSIDTYNQFFDNQVQDILGSRGLDGVATDPNQTTGCGIYVVGVGTGGAQVHNNAVQNCCINTRTRTVLPAGIGVTAVPTGLVPISVIGNSVDQMSQGDGILISGGPTNGQGGATVSNNTISMPSSNNGTGVGGGALLGAQLRIESGAGSLDNVVVGPNNGISYGTGQGLYLYANSGNLANLVITGGSYSVQASGSGTPFQAAQNGGFNITQLTINGTKFRAVAGSGTNPAANLNAIIAGYFSNCAFISNVGVGLLLNGCTNMRVTGGEISGTGGTNIQTTGTCTNCFIDKTVDMRITTGATGSVVNNAGTGGCNIEQNFSSVPSAGTWNTGDRAVHLGVTVGTAKGWSRVTTGSGNVLGTDWITEGNL